MDSKHLRIGNLIYNKTSQDNHIVKGIDCEDGTWIQTDLDLSYCWLDNFEPIPLTEKCLLIKLQLDMTKLEFVNRYFIDDFCIDYNRTHKTFSFLIGYEHEVNLDSFHQLQNLYFALTNTELYAK